MDPQLARLPLPPPALFDAAGQPQLGRFRAPVPQPDLPTSRWRLKEWQYVSFASQDWFLAFAVVQLGYVANAFCYLVERATGRMWQMEKLAPLGRGLTIAPSSLQGTTRWQRGGDRLEVQAIAAGWRIDLDVLLHLAGVNSTGRDRRQGVRLRTTLTLQAEEALALVHPLAPDRIAYTHKAAGMPAHGTLTWAEETLDVQGLATLDWTRSQALRTTRWKWGSLVHVLPDGRRLGLNLSAEVYDGPDGVSRENAAWLDGVVYPLGIAQFQVPADPQREAWRITGPEVELTFGPMGTRQQDVQLGLISSRFVQPFGLFTGSLTIMGQRLTIEGAFGVVEDHLARW